MPESADGPPLMRNSTLRSKSPSAPFHQIHSLRSSFCPSGISPVIAPSCTRQYCVLPLQSVSVLPSKSDCAGGVSASAEEARSVRLTAKPASREEGERRNIGRETVERGSRKELATKRQKWRQKERPPGESSTSPGARFSTTQH